VTRVKGVEEEGKPGIWRNHGRPAVGWGVYSLFAASVVVVDVWEAVNVWVTVAMSIAFGVGLTLAGMAAIKWRSCHQYRVRMWRTENDPLVKAALRAVMEGDRETFQQARDALSREGFTLKLEGDLPW
jgi:hypothetical protein